MSKDNIDLSEIVSGRTKSTTRKQLSLVWKLSIPAIFAQLTSIIMQYIDAGMVGKLGAKESAAIGLVASSTWLLGGLVHSSSAGFSVLVAQLIGAGNIKNARQVLKKSLVVALAFSLLLVIIGVFVSGVLPIWLGGEKNIRTDASMYFIIYACSIPFLQLKKL